MGIKIEKKTPSSSSSTSPCAQLRAAYHNCFNRWYSEKFLKGHWDKEECVSEWQKYRDCLSQHLEDKHLSRFLEAEAIVDQTDQANFGRPVGAYPQATWQCCVGLCAGYLLLLLYAYSLQSTLQST